MTYFDNMKPSGRLQYSRQKTQIIVRLNQFLPYFRSIITLKGCCCQAFLVSFQRQCLLWHQIDHLTMHIKMCRSRFAYEHANVVPSFCLIVIYQGNIFCIYGLNGTSNRKVIASGNVCENKYVLESILEVLFQSALIRFNPTTCFVSTRFAYGLGLFVTNID